MKLGEALDDGKSQPGTAPRCATLHSARLEALAKEHGSAVGMAQALPASIERIAQWAKAAETRGIVLVPITAIAVKPKSS